MNRESYESSARIDSMTNTEPTRDKYNITYIIFFIAGAGSLLPWNFFCTAIPYFQYKLRDDSAGNAMFAELSPEQVLFGNYLALCSMLPLALFNILNLFLVKWISAFVRFIVGSVVVFLMILLTVILVHIELGAQLFLGITLCSVVIINSAAAIVQGSLLGIASVLPPRNIRAFLEGQASSGVIAAVAQILSLAGSSLITTSAFAYFLVALIFLGLSTALTLALKRNEHFLYYWKAESTYQTKEEESKDRGANASGLSADTLDTLVESNGQHKTGSSPMRLLKSLGEMWVHGCCVMVTLMFTLMLFPALLQPIKSMIDDPENVWASKFFIPVIVFLSFNLFDWIGRTLAGFIKWPRVHQRWILLAFCLARVVIVPLCMFMNQQPRRHLPVVFMHDAFPIILVILLGLTNGYFVSLAMTYGPSFASPGTNEGAGAALSIYMSLGLSLGVAVSAGLALAI